MDLLTFLEDTNFDDFIKKYFGGDAISFIKFLDSKNLLDEFMDKFENEGYFTDVLNAKYSDDPQYVIDYVISNYFTDISNDGNKYWLTIDRDDLSNYFDHNRYDASPNMVRQMLGDDAPDLSSYHDMPNLSDLISDLNKLNFNSLKDSVYNEVEGDEVEIDGEVDIVTKETIESMDYQQLSDFINENTPDVYSELNQLYNSSYESALYDEFYSDINSELIGLFQTPEFSRHVPYKRKTYKKGSSEPIEVNDYRYQVDVTKLVPEVIKGVLDWNGNHSDNDFEYYADFEGLLQAWLEEEGELLRVPYPDYPDYTVMSELINDMFDDYIS